MKTGVFKEHRKKMGILELVFIQPFVMTDSGEIDSDLYLPLKS